MKKRNMVVVHIDERGDLAYHAAGNVTLLIVDERAPSDRVYEFQSRTPRKKIAEIVGPEKDWGQPDEQKTIKILRHTEGLNLVSDNKTAPDLPPRSTR